MDTKIVAGQDNVKEGKDLKIEISVPQDDLVKVVSLSDLDFQIHLKENELEQKQGQLAGLNAQRDKVLKLATAFDKSNK